MAKAKVKPKDTAKAKSKGKRRAPTPDYNDSTEEDEDNELNVDFLTTDPNSPFVNMDLIAEYSSPEFRALLTDQDKIEISELLPDHISLTEEGYFHNEFVRYDNDFRHAIRMYQQDLAAGRYDPEWLRQAAEAMEQRANGDFDEWKDQEFEEFWGQKQKLDSKAKAGQSGAVKLNRLVEAGLFKEGDIFSYMRTFGRGKAKITVEKDVKIIEIDGTSMTFAIPPRQLKFARRLAPDEAESREPRLNKNEQNIPTNSVVAETIAGELPSKETNAKNANTQEPMTGDTTAVEATKKATMTKEMGDGPAERGEDEATPIVSVDSSGDNKTGGSKAGELNDSHAPCTGIIDPNPHSSPASSSSQLSDIPPNVDDVILVTITTLQALENKIVATDGRLGKTVDGNAFKHIRVKRDNQDIGSLFEIREDWYTYKK